MISTEVLISTEVASLTVKLPYIPVDPEIVVDPEMNTGCNKGLTYDAVLEKDAETAFSTYEAVLLKEALTAFRMQDADWANIMKEAVDAKLEETAFSI